MIKFFCASNDREQLTRNIVNNPYIKDAEIQLDNNRDKGLPERYNEFIDKNLNSDCWLVFLHDDVELLEDIEPKIAGIPKDIIYGACGAKKTNGKGEIVGQILAQDNRVNNGDIFVIGRFLSPLGPGYEIVPTFDPLIIIVHTELLGGCFWLVDKWINKNPFRFDEQLGYHLFSEELSINAKKNYGIKSAVIQLDLCHYSWGTKTQEYYQAHEYILKKHNLKRFIGTCEHQCMDDQEEEGWN